MIYKLFFYLYYVYKKYKKYISMLNRLQIVDKVGCDWVKCKQRKSIVFFYAKK